MMREQRAAVVMKIVVILFTLLTALTTGSFLRPDSYSHKSKRNNCILTVPAHKEEKVQDLPCSLPIKDATLHLIHNRRCLLIPSREINNRNVVMNIRDDDSKKGKVASTPPPPLILLGGMAQCIETWQHHFPDLSKERDVLMYEYCGSGLVEGPSGINQSDYYKNIGMDFQVKDFARIVKTVFTECEEFDIIAFSLGGRIALEVIASSTSNNYSRGSRMSSTNNNSEEEKEKELFNNCKIRKAHITGVSAERGPLSKIIFSSWKDLLSQESSSNDNNIENLKPFAWSLIMSTYSDRFLALNGPEKVSSWVEHISSNHKRLGLLELIKQTGQSDPIELASYIRENSDTLIQFAVGRKDKISIQSEVEKLHHACSLKGDVLVYNNCGHAVLNEGALQWRRDALKFLNG